MGLWKDLFGESQQEAWTRLAQNIGGAWTPGTWTQPSTVRAQLGGFDIALDTFTVSTGKSSQTYTRLRAPFVNARGLRFAIHRASIFSGLAKALGQQDLEIGVPDFDRDFVIQGNDHERVKHVLSDPALRALLVAQPRVRVEIVDDEGIFGPKFGNGVDQLSFVEGGVIKDVPRLAGLFSLLAGLLHAFRDGAQHFLEVPSAQLPSSFQHMVDSVVESLGGHVARVHDDVEARMPDALGLGLEARVTLALPALPALSSSLRFDGALPAGAGAFTADKRGVVELGTVKTGDSHVDAAFAIRGDLALAQRLLRPLGALAATKPKIEVTSDHLLIVAESIGADFAAGALGASLDLWQEIMRTRIGM